MRLRSGSVSRIRTSRSDLWLCGVIQVPLPRFPRPSSSSWFRTLCGWLKDARPWSTRIDHFPSQGSAAKLRPRSCSVIANASRPPELRRTSPRRASGGRASAPLRAARESACRAASEVIPKERMARTIAACGMPSGRSSPNCDRIARNVLDAVVCCPSLAGRGAIWLATNALHYSTSQPSTVGTLAAAILENQPIAGEWPACGERREDDGRSGARGGGALFTAPRSHGAKEGF